jgi:thiamine-phosphate pyrophosphorylase
MTDGEMKELRHARRIIDANLNRIAEGLRVLEDVARLALEDAGISRRLKGLRHELRRLEIAEHRRLLESRDAAGDVGAEITVPGQEQPRVLYETVVANARRVQESLRVMEELAKTAGLSLEPDIFKRARFELYSLEKEMAARLKQETEGSQ